MDPAAQPASAQPPTLNEALDRLWSRFQPEIEQRVAILDAATAAGSSLTRAQREAAHSAAHKLAGVLGTFGLAEGTALARELEHLFAPEGAPDAANAQKLVELSSRLRTIVENRK